MKTLLIPTDFKLQSLNCIPQLTKQLYPHKLNIIMVHVISVTDSITELLMLSRRSAEYRYIPDAFYMACKEIKESYKNNVNEIRIEFFYGNTVAAFKNFLDANEVDAIVDLANYDYELLTEKSSDPTLLMSRSGMKIMTVDTELPAVKVEYELQEELEEQKV
ncbi:hypothetical protein [Mucilaginibacter polytrichastri]|uniref:UspA domain-containing protein n=1 Tax=Mucilaginibacter polytrichastri TaxID=1302689 RepID=A0A1Q5ZYQ7_9SPHI|nr:hypothetical protein [Mucilaginibacter polytrichastri]OKS86879.1 hypothetical protein RG47T_2337 [Mucilaginibacter polytrichastri]SFT17690.1 hypothetical protein SAMN04487890_11462 [Mucilaginibacter polytrichastri]